MAHIRDLANTMRSSEGTFLSPTSAFVHPHLRVLFVTDRLDAPFRYRCLHPCLQLRAEGVPADITLLDSLSPLALSAYSIVVFFRLPWSEKAEVILRECRKKAISVLFDIDDLIFDPRVITSLPFWDTVSVSDRAKYIDLATRLAKTFRECDGFIGATRTLADAAFERGKQAFVSPNILHPSIVRVSPLLRRLRKITATRPVISYMSGSATHDLDFLRVAASLRKILTEQKDALLLVGGFLDLRGYFPTAHAQIIRLPFVDWFVLPWIQSLAWVNIAPLAELDQFSHSKSALKFFEAGILGVPTVASPSAALKETIREGVNGFLPTKSRDWYESMRACLDWETSRKLGEAACRTAYEEHTTTAQRHKLRTQLSLLVQDGWEPPKVESKPARRGALSSALRAHFPGRSRQSMHRVRSILGVLTKSQNLERLRLSFPHSAPPKVEQWVATDPALDGFGERNGNRVWVLPTPDSRSVLDKQSGWEVAWELLAAELEPGAWISVGMDPCLLGPEQAFESLEYRFLVLEIQVTAEVPQTHAQLYWLKESAPTYHEDESVLFPVLCDGKRHTYVVDLHRPRFGSHEMSSWSTAGRILRLRFDPVQMPAQLRIHRFMLVGPGLLVEPQLWAALGKASLLDELAHNYLVGEGALLGASDALTRWPSTAEVLFNPHSLKPLKQKSLDFCFCNLKAASDVPEAIQDGTQAVRSGGSVFAVWPGAGEANSPMLPEGVTLIEQFSHPHGASHRHVLVLKVV